MGLLSFFNLRKSYQNRVNCNYVNMFNSIYENRNKDLKDKPRIVSISTIHENTIPSLLPPDADIRLLNTKSGNIYIVDLSREGHTQQVKEGMSITVKHGDQTLHATLIAGYFNVSF